MRVLLFANTGTDQHGFYHVGDEAILQGSYYFYQKYFPHYALSTLTSGPLYSKYQLQEELGLAWPQDLWGARVYYVKLAIKTLLWRHFNLSLFSHDQKKFIEFIHSHDLVHLVGGGYLTSECGGWMYYGLLILNISSQLKIRTIMTSQTIGPFHSFFDRYLVVKAINTTEMITLRTKSTKQMLALKQMGITKPTINTSLDGAYFLPSKLSKKSIILTTKKTLRIGLSLHAIEGKNVSLKQIIQEIMNATTETKKHIELLLLPHILHQQMSWDLSFMQKIVAELPPSIKIITPDYYSLASLSELSQIIKGLTATCDYVISSRYHGVVFALSESIPCLAIVGNAYQYMKNSEALRFVFNTRFKDYLIDLRTESAVEDARLSWKQLLANRSPLRIYIRKKNRLLSNVYDSYLVFLKQVIMREGRV